MREQYLYWENLVVVLISESKGLYGNNRFRYLSNSLRPSSQQIRYILLSVNHWKYSLNRSRKNLLRETVVKRLYLWLRLCVAGCNAGYCRVEQVQSDSGSEWEWCNSIHVMSIGLGTNDFPSIWQALLPLSYKETQVQRKAVLQLAIRESCI